jgi:predicted AAA+ superfamily ATPase
MIERRLTASVLEALAAHPVVFLRGARQTGKTTLVAALAAQGHPATYLTLDDPDTLAAAVADPAGFVAAFPVPVIVDEVRRAPGLALAIKRAVDQDRSAGRFLLTGSAQVLVLPSLSRELVGRMGILTLWPFSQSELDGRRERFIDWLFGEQMAAPPVAEPCDRQDLLRRACTGGFPEAVAADSARTRDAWSAAYLDTVLQRDIGSLAQIEGLVALPRLLSLLAARAGGLLNVAELSRTAAMPRSTLDRYLALLSGVFLLQLLPAWSSDLGKRLVKSPKAYLTDTGLQAYLLGLSPQRLAAEPRHAGPLLEAFAFAEIAKLCTWSAARPSLSHFRSHAGREVDFVLEDRAGRVVGIEVKAAETVSEADTAGLRALAELAGERFHRGVVLYAGRRSLPFGPRLHVMPLSALWRLEDA